MQTVKKFSSMISNTFFCTCRSRVGDRNPFLDDFCLFCRRRNFLVAELSGNYRQVGDVPSLEFFVVERGRAKFKKMHLAVGDRDVLIPEAIPGFLCAECVGKIFRY